MSELGKLILYQCYTGPGPVSGYRYPDTGIRILVMATLVPHLGLIVRRGLFHGVCICIQIVTTITMHNFKI